MAHHKVNACKNCINSESYAGDFMILCRSPHLGDRVIMQACYVRNDPSKCSVEGKWFVTKKQTITEKIVNFFTFR